uniref:Uncharacterized protein n=1 Tax=Meleagris gallopavo TaxID=9103 RepID=A0A803Y6X9_MELGA
MAYDDSKKKEESDRSADDIRAHREKKRYYKDLVVQEEERIAAQVRKPAEKTLKVYESVKSLRQDEMGCLKVLLYRKIPVEESKSC